MNKLKLLNSLIFTSALSGGITGGTLSSCDSSNKDEIQSPQANIQYYFSQDKDHLDQQLIQVINSAKQNLDIAIFSLTKKDIVNAILQAKNRGVNVRIISDRTEANTALQNKEVGMLNSSNIPIKVNTHEGLMHLKVTIADNIIVTVGSYNYSDAATFINDEVLVIIKDSNIAKDFEKQFERMWNDNKNFTSFPMSAQSTASNT